jgi:hypothetical protein
MLRVRWELHLFAVLCVLCASTAGAQTVIVTHVPPGTTIDFVLDSIVVGSAMANNAGTATIQTDKSVLGDRQVDALVRVDVCGMSRRIVVYDRNRQPPPTGTCTRTEVGGVFIVRAVTSLVFDLQPTPPTLRIRQGPAPAEWLRDADVDAGLTAKAKRVPTGLFVFGGGGVSDFKDFADVQCGNINCNAQVKPAIFNGGVEYWVLPYLGAEASFLKPGTPTASYSDSTFNFTTETESGLFTAAALGGIPIGPVRIVGKIGGAYHKATTTTVENVVEQTVTVDGAPQVALGGSQTIQTRTGGWGWLWSVGGEVWLTGPIGFYGEWGRFTMVGPELRGGETKLDETVGVIMGGAKVRLPLPW